MSPSSTAARVPDKELIPVDEAPSLKELPYFKHVELPRYTPQQFGLEKWTRLFVIPDHWMRKIYKHEMWRDTDLPEPTTEKLTKNQKLILYRWLTYHSPFKDDLPVPPSLVRKARSKYNLCDDLIDLLDRPQEEDNTDDTCDTTELLLGREALDATNVSNQVDESPGIPVCYGHKIQPEKAIVEKAIDRMKSLSEQEETLFKTLIADNEFTELLNATIAKYLANQKSYSTCDESVRRP